MELSGPHAKVFTLMSDGRERTGPEIAEAIGADTASATAYVRKLRHVDYGAHCIPSRRIGKGKCGYRLVTADARAVAVGGGIKVDPEFHALGHTLPAEALATLKELIQRDGIREPLLLWGDVLIDGHHRFQIAQMLGIDFPTAPIAFLDRDEAKVWILDNQYGRRNLNDYQRTRNRLGKKELLAAKGKERQSAAGGDHAAVEGKALLTTLSKADKPHNTRAEIAREAGVAEGTVSKVEFIVEHAPQETKDQLERNEVTINKAYTATKAATPKKGAKTRRKAKPRNQVTAEGGRKVTAARKMMDVFATKMAERIRTIAAVCGMTPNNQKCLASSLAKLTATIDKAIQESL